MTQKLFQLVYLVISLLIIPINIKAQWIKTSSPSEKVPAAFLSVAAKGDTLFAGSYLYSGIFRSTDDGKNWTQVLPYYYINDIKINNNVVYAASYFGLFRSYDFGKTWHSDKNGLIHGPAGVLSIAFVRYDIFAATDAGVFKSSDGGADWINISPNYPRISNLIINIISKDTLLIIGTYNGILKSTDLGATWQYCNTGLDSQLGEYYPRINILVKDSNAIFAGTTDYGVYKSTDDGSTWKAVRSGLPFIYGSNTIYQSIYSLGVKDNKLYCCPDGDGCIYSSSDFGKTWLKISSRITYSIIFEFDENNNEIFAASLVGILRSTDNGVKWDNILPNIQQNMSVNALSNSGNSIIASGYNNYWDGSTNNTYLSTDGGREWLETTTFDSTNPNYFNTFYTGNNFILGGTYIGIYRSTDKGKTWKYSSDFAGKTPVNTFLSYNNEILAGTGRYVAIPDGPTPPNNGITYGGGVYISFDNGNSWQTSGLMNEIVYDLKTSGNNIYAGTMDGVFISKNGGITWSNCSNGIQKNYAITSLAILGTNVFACTYSGVYKSDYNCANWGLVNEGLPINDFGLSFKIYSFDYYLFAPTPKGIYLYKPDEQKWINISTGLDSISANVLTMSSANGLIYAGTQNGIWQRSISDIYSYSNKGAIINRLYELGQNYPNPFSLENGTAISTDATTTINFTITYPGDVTLRVYDSIGRLVKTLINGYKIAGRYLVNFHANELASGVYYYQLRINGAVITKKMLYLK